MEPFIGQIIQFAGNFAPRGWALCDGQLLPIASYSALFSILGTTYGGDGRTTFGLPDMRGRVSMHWGQGPGLTNRAIGHHSGQESVTLTLQQIPAHNHALVPIQSVNTDEANSNDPSHPLAETDNLNFTRPGSPDGLAPPTFEPFTQDSGGSQVHDNMQPYLCVTHIIALEGLFPSRS